jgi:hypothetical protein
MVAKVKGADISTLYIYAASGSVNQPNTTGTK